MARPGLRRSLLLWLVTALAACASIELAQPVQPLQPVQEPSRRWADGAERLMRIAQHGYGAAAAFVSCLPVSCPQATRKSIDPAPAAEDSADALRASAVPAHPGPTQAEPYAERPAATSDTTADTAADTTADPIVLVITFAFGSSDLTPGDRDAIEHAVETARPVRRVSVVGRTDATGPPSVNESLARARASAVTRYLLRTNPELATKVETRSQGLCCYVASNDSPAGRARNRRAEIVLERDGGDL